MDRETPPLTLRRALWILPGLLLFVGLVAGWVYARNLRADYDGYRSRIQPGVRIAGVDVGWRTPEEAAELVREQIARPYTRPFRLELQGETLSLSPVEDLGLRVAVDEMVQQAVAASHRGDYWPGFWQWLRGEAPALDLDVPLDLAWDEAAAANALARLAEQVDRPAVEPMVDVQARTFLPGKPGRAVRVEEAAALINARVAQPDQRELALPVDEPAPDQSPARIRAMLSTLGPVMEVLPTPPSFYTATLPVSSTGGIAGTPLISYTGELTWTFPHFAGYTGPLTSTTGFFFDLGRPGSRLDVSRAVRQVGQALRAGVTEPITFAADPYPPPPLSPGLLVPPLEARLAQFEGVSSLLVKNLDTGEVAYDRSTDYVLSGMSVVKIGIMVEVYRAGGGSVDAQTHQELRDMLGSESCNPCANRLLAQVGGGSATAGAQKVTQTMRRLGLANFYLCAPFRVVETWGSGVPLLAGGSTLGLWGAQAAVPGYDRCVRATPREMANLLDMIYTCAQGRGPLHDMYPSLMRPAVCGEMLEIMAANDLRNMLGAGIPAEVKLAHKHGFAGYGVSWGDTRAEVGIVFSPGATYLVSFYIWQDSPWIDFGIVQPLYRDVSNLLYNYYNAAQPYWAPPPWAPRE